MKVCDIFNIYSEDHKYTEEYIYKHRGPYPVYSATLNKAYGYCDSFKYDETIILVVNYGDAGKIRVISGKFNIGRNVTGLSLKKEFINKIDIHYASIILEKILLSELNKGNMGCISQHVLKNIKFLEEFPLIAEQNAIVMQYKKLEQIKTKILLELRKVNSLFEQELKLKKYITLSVSEIAILNKGSNRISEEMLYKNNSPEGIPVYSSATENKGLMGKVTTECYESFHKQGNAEELTWTTNGYAGKVFYRDSNYLYSEKCGRIVIKEKYKNRILPQYLCFMLNQITYKYKTSESNNGKLDIIHMEKIPVDIPIGSKEEIDIEFQEKVIRLYQKIEFIKNNLTSIKDKLEKIYWNECN